MQQSLKQCIKCRSLVTLAPTNKYYCPICKVLKDIYEVR